MRKMVKRLLKKYKYPPEDYDFAINTVISQCELWTDNSDMECQVVSYTEVLNKKSQDLQMIAEESDTYGIKKEK